MSYLCNSCGFRSEDELVGLNHRAQHQYQESVEKKKEVDRAIERLDHAGIELEDAVGRYIDWVETQEIPSDEEVLKGAHVLAARTMPGVQFQDLGPLKQQSLLDTSREILNLRNQE